MSVHFSCVGCGKCCTSGPQMSVREAIGLMHELPLMACVNAFQLSNDFGNDFDGRFAGAVRDFADRLGGVRAMVGTTAGPAKALFVLDVVSPGAHLKTGCAALGEDGRCKVYERRPPTCRYLPLQSFMPKENQQDAIALFKSQHGDDCDWSPEAPLLLDDRGAVANDAFWPPVQTYEDGRREDAALLRALHEWRALFVPGSFVFTVGALIAEALKDPRGEIRFPMVALIGMMHDLSSRGFLGLGYNLPRLTEFADAQCGIIEREIVVKGRRKGRPAKNYGREMQDLLMATRAINGRIKSI